MVNELHINSYLFSKTTSGHCTCMSNISDSITAFCHKLYSQLMSLKSLGKFTCNQYLIYMKICTVCTLVYSQYSFGFSTEQTLPHHYIISNIFSHLRPTFDEYIPYDSMPQQPKLFEIHLSLKSVSLTACVPQEYGEMQQFLGASYSYRIFEACFYYFSMFCNIVC